MTINITDCDHCHQDHYHLSIHTGNHGIRYVICPVTKKALFVVVADRQHRRVGPSEVKSQ